jgi:hypothetical protein
LSTPLGWNGPRVLFAAASMPPVALMPPERLRPPERQSLGSGSAAGFVLLAASSSQTLPAGSHTPSSLFPPAHL